MDLQRYILYVYKRHDQCEQENLRFDSQLVMIDLISDVVTFTEEHTGIFLAVIYHKVIISQP
jgi:hypothetical protein